MYKWIFSQHICKNIFNMVNSVQCEWVALNVLSIFNVILTIIYVVNVNVFHILLLLKCKCFPLKLVVVLIHCWQIREISCKNAKLMQNKLGLSKKKDKGLPIFSCPIKIILTNRQTDKQNSNMYISISAVFKLWLLTVQ